MTDLIATMTGQQYRAAFASKASNDVRYYLDGIYIHAERGKAVATNGHMMYYTDIEIGPAATSLIFDAPKIPASATSVTVEDFGKYNVLVKVYGRAGRQLGQHICKVIDGKYPNYQAVIPVASGQEPGPGAAFRFDTEYLALLKTIFGRTQLRFEMTDSNSAASITDAKHPDAGTVILVPVRT